MKKRGIVGIQAKDIKIEELEKWAHNVDRETKIKWQLSREEAIDKISDKLMDSKFIAGRPTEEIQVFLEVAHRIIRAVYFNYENEDKLIQNIVQKAYDKSEKEKEILRGPKELREKMLELLTELIFYNKSMVCDQIMIDKYTEKIIKEKKQNDVF